MEYKNICYGIRKVSYLFSRNQQLLLRSAIKDITMAAERIKIIFHHLHGKNGMFAPVSFNKTGNKMCSQT
jgi:hypothetical protein